MIPIGAHWYDIIYGKTYADADVLCRKQCEYLGIPLDKTKQRSKTIMGIKTKYQLFIQE